MKQMFLLVPLMLLATAARAENVVKSCDFVVKIPGESKEIPTSYNIVTDGTKLTAKGSQIIDGQLMQLPDEAATFNEYDVRAGITENTPGLNDAEQLIAGTISFLNAPELAQFFDVGLDLTAIRHAKVYQVGRFTHMGGTVIIEAKDASGKDLGSFLTGFFPFACAR